MTSYKLTRDGGVIRIEVGAVTTFDPNGGTSEAELYAAWLTAGNTPEPTDPPTRDEINAPILAQLAALDAKTVRPLRAILAAEGPPDPRDVAALADLRAQADALRSQLQ